MVTILNPADPAGQNIDEIEIVYKLAKNYKLPDY